MAVGKRRNCGKNTFAEVMTTKLGFRRCKSDPNLYCHESGRLYVLAYVDDLLVVGTDEMRKSFMSQLSEEVLLKETGQLVPGSEHTFPRTKTATQW